MNKHDPVASLSWVSWSVNRPIYRTAKMQRKLFALDAGTGKANWHFHPHRQAQTNGSFQGRNSSFIVWKGVGISRCGVVCRLAA
jgi:glucose dehydrogenase